MSKEKIVVVVGFLIAFGAGLVVGLQVRRPVPAAAPAAERWWLTAELDLTPQQEQQAKAIWARIRQQHGEMESRRRAIREQRDQAVKALLTDTQRAEYDAILESYAQQMSQMGQAHRQIWQDGMNSIRALLTESQQQKFDTMREKWRSEWRRPGSGPSTRRQTTQPATVPASE